MRTPSAVRFVRIALRLSLATAILSAVADRFGWWAPLAQGSWGSRSATCTESTSGVLLLTGWSPRLVGAATGAVLMVFGLSMGVSRGMESPLGYSAFSAASAAAAYAMIGAESLSHTTGVLPVAR